MHDTVDIVVHSLIISTKLLPTATTIPLRGVHNYQRKPIDTGVLRYGQFQPPPRRVHEVLSEHPAADTVITQPITLHIVSVVQSPALVHMRALQ